MTDLPDSVTGKDALEVAVAAARQAGAILTDRFRGSTKAHFKGRANIVTEADLEAERAIISLLRAEFPDHGILSEESEPIAGDAGLTWILDPLDGTNNFSFGIPLFCVVLALTRSDESLLGVIYDPLRDELFSARKGGGAYLNGQPMSVTRKTTVPESLVGLDLGYVDENGKRLLQLLARLWPNVYAFRLMGSAALSMAYVACGRLDLYFHLLLYPWELACGQLLVTEAGGVATNWSGAPLGTQGDSIVASNPEVHADFLARLRDMA